MISENIYVPVSSEVLDLIHIIYGVKIDSQKYPEDEADIVSMEEVSYKYLGSEIILIYMET